MKFIVVNEKGDCPLRARGPGLDDVTCTRNGGDCRGPGSASCPLEDMNTSDTEWSWSDVERDIEMPPEGHNPDTVYLSKVVLESEAKQKLAVKDMHISRLIELLVKEREQSMHYRCNIGEEQGLCDGKCLSCEDNPENARAQIEKELKEGK